MASAASTSPSISKAGGNGLRSDPAIPPVHFQKAIQHILFRDTEAQTKVGREAGIDELFGVAGHGQDKGGFAKGKTFRERGITAVDDEGVSAGEQGGVVHLTTVKRYVAVRFT